jgi:hypothetical protein
MWVQICPVSPASTGICPQPVEWLDLSIYMAGPGQYDLLGITPAEILQTFSWGFGVVALFWSLGFALSTAINVIKRV